MKNRTEYYSVLFLYTKIARVKRGHIYERTEAVREKGVLFIVKRGVNRVKILAVKMVLYVTQCFAETLEMYYFALT